MKVQEVILKAMAGSLKWWEAAEIIGVSDRTMRRWRERYFDFNARHFHEKLAEEHRLKISYTWVKLALQTAKLVDKQKRRRPHPAAAAHAGDAAAH